MCNESQEFVQNQELFSTRIAYFHKNIGKLPHHDGYGNPAIFG